MLLHNDRRFYYKRDAFKSEGWRLEVGGSRLEVGELEVERRKRLREELRV